MQHRPSGQDAALRSLAVAPLPSLHASTESLAFSATAAGALGIIDVTAAWLDGPDATQALRSPDRERLCLRIEPRWIPRLAELLQASAQVRWVLISPSVAHALTAAEVASLRAGAHGVMAEVVSLQEALDAQAAGCDAVLAKGWEAAGRVGGQTSFMLAQTLRGKGIPFWVQGGLSPATAAACRVAGAEGFVLDTAFALTDEATLSVRRRQLLKAMDGSESICLGETLGLGFRVHRLQGRAYIARMQSAEITGDAAAFLAARDEGLADASDDGLWPVGQDANLAHRLKLAHGSVASIVAAYNAALSQPVDQAGAAWQPGSALARRHGTRYPLVQGPMTRVSDVPEFALAVADAGALPMIALALLREAEAASLLQATKELLGDRPWGVGLLGFVPAELRAQQLRAVMAQRPRFAIVAGGRPDQALALEQAGITAYIHCPSARLLEMFLREGARRFIFEGRECGGHIGPTSSFVLWDAALHVLERFAAEHPGEPVQVLFAGGIHDKLSAAMVATMSAGARAAGIEAGLLLGTAYLFTEEAVKSGAIVQAYQDETLRCTQTVTLDASGGHMIRVAQTPYAQEFESLKQKYLGQGMSPSEARDELEEANVGRLRMAAKGVARSGHNGPLLPVSPEIQYQQGMYMLGEVAVLRQARCTMASLHQEICMESTATPNAPAAQDSAVTAQAPATSGPVPIAIIGMSCIFPDSPDLDTYWRNIMLAANAVREVPAERWSSEYFFDVNQQAPDRTMSKWGGFIEPIRFDPLRFGIPPTSLDSIEPMQLITLELVRRALEHAGFDERPFPRERTSVVIGTGGTLCDLGAAYETRALVAHYLQEAIEIPADVRQQVLEALQKRMPVLNEDSLAGILPNVIAGRVANRFDLGGMNCSVDAACGSSFAALDLAVKELRYGNSDVAVVGAVEGNQNVFAFQLFSKTRALSPNGRCAPFDEEADGIAVSDGVGVMILKRLPDAERDGDTIYGVIRDVAASSDGKDKSMTAPSVRGQRRALERAYARIDVKPSDVGLVEAHGTGTKAGDRAELDTLCEVYSAHGAPAQNTQLGSVKSMIGHTRNAAGLAGLIKCTLGLHHRTLPPTRYTKPNPTVSDRSGPFFLSGKPRPWFRTDGAPRRAAASAFGFGGTNFHVVLEEYGAHTASASLRPAELLLLRAHDANALVQELEALQALAVRPDVRLADLALALDTREKTAQGDCRVALVAADNAELGKQISVAIKTLREGRSLATAGPVMTGAGPRNHGALAFLFPGQGSQSLNMLDELALYFPVVREKLELADATVGHLLPQSLLKTVYPAPAYNEAEAAEQRQQLNQTWSTQPALGACDMAMHALLARFGVHADMAAGHSYGEYAALCAAGVYSYHDLLRLSELRGRVATETQGSDAVAMLAVNAAPTPLAPLLKQAPGVAIAIMNAPQQTTLGGTRAAIDVIVPLLEAQGIRFQRIAMSAGFHIPEAVPAAVRFARAITHIKFAAPRMSVMAGITGHAYPSEATAIRHLLIEQFTKPISYQSQVEALWQAGARTFIEVGPGNVMTSLARQTLGDRAATLLAPQRSGSNNSYADFLSTLGRLYADGLALDRSALYEQRALPGRSFDDLAKPLLPAKWTVDTGRVHWASRPAVKVEAAKATPAVAAVPVPKALPTPQPQPVAAAPVVVAHDVAQASAMTELQTMLELFKQQQAEAHRQREDLLNRLAAHSFGAPVQAAVVMPAAKPMAMLSATPTPAARPVPAAPVAPVATVDVLATLIDLVSQRTGYPADMLQLDHNIEADLGIDSIKRTEILGSLRTHLHLEHSLESEAFFSHGARLRTLAELRDWLQGQVKGAPAAAVQKPVAQPAPVSRAVVQPAAPVVAAQPALDVSAVLIDAISERTGYPSEMLQFDQVIEADLGIDSIKRTEILGSLRSQLKLEHSLESEAFFSAGARLRTLADLRDWLQGQMGAAPAVATRATPQAAPQATPSAPVIAAKPFAVPQPAAFDVSAVLIDAISERTGYPAEMLQFDQVIEADLGIDSIKRTEILGSLRSRLQLEDALDSEAFFSAGARLRTLADLRDWLHGQQGTAPAVAAQPAPVAATAAAVVAKPVAVASVAPVAALDVSAVLIDAISERTGYPAEMLQFDQVIEADLGIDSIKRTEILGSLRGRLQLENALDSEAFFSAGARLRTLADLRDWLSGQRDKVAPPAIVAAPLPVTDVMVAPLAAATDTLDLAAVAHHVKTLLIEAVSERTGYPSEMLQFDQVIEADLGIDSIKRTEIASTLREQLSLHNACESETFFQHVGKIRTLGDMHEWLLMLSGGVSESPTQALALDHVFTDVDAEQEAGLGGAQRFLVRAVPSPMGDPSNPLASLIDAFTEGPKRRCGVLLITEDESGEADRVASMLQDSGLPVRIARVRHGATLGELGDARFEADLLSMPSLAELRQLISQRMGTVTDLWHVLPFDAASGRKSALESRSLLCLAKTFGADLRAAHGTLTALTGMGGDSGISGECEFRPGEAALSGLMKSLAQEWPEVTVRCWDSDRRRPGNLPDSWPDFDDRQALEVGYVQGERMLLTATDAPLDAQRTAQITLDPECVILLIGGARGIAAQIAVDLARRYGCKFVIAGRSAMPAGESTHTAGVSDNAELKRALAGQIKAAGKVPSPREVEAAHRQLIAAREMTGTFDRLTELGTPYEYHAMDAADAKKLGALVADVYQRYGRIDGVIHAAGVVCDGLVENKTLDQFDAVFSTKVMPALTLCRALKPEALRFMVFFSSVAARFGCAGGADYAAANEALNRLAWHLDRRWPARVVSIGWGPWAEVGMATRYGDSLHAENGLDWLTVEAGCQRMREELIYGRKGEAEVVIYVPRGDGPGYRAASDAEEKPRHAVH